ncbi:MAG: hypothetical protein JWR68_1735 [Polaromonas sp.]|nr:hypothetical protein [Polaromonas sp.]
MSALGCGFSTTTTRMTDHYTTLGLGSTATLADIKKAFRQKASHWHPDRNAAPQAAERFRAVQSAYEVLSDAAKRQAYDDNRRRNLLDSPLDTAQEIWASYFNPLLDACGTAQNPDMKQPPA